MKVAHAFRFRLGESELIEEKHCVDQAAVCNPDSSCPLPEMFKAVGTRRANGTVVLASPGLVWSSKRSLRPGCQSPAWL